ncbi:hypothetical protein Btru_060768 [Bulinus truncatus]|nr:hypothetical protein Btru_060768 [Bulinus truncatus]
MTREKREETTMTMMIREGIRTTTVTGVGETRREEKETTTTGAEKMIKRKMMTRAKSLILKRRKKQLFEQFKDWLQGQKKQEQEKEEEQEEYKDYLKKNFKEYIKRKVLQEQEEREEKAAIYRQMEKVHIKKLLNEKLYSLTEQYKEGKLQFMYEITEHFFSFCKCDNSKDTLERIHNGQFGSPNMSSDTSLLANENFDLEEFNNMTMNLSNSTVAQYINDPVQRLEHIKWFDNLERQDQVKFVLHEYIQIMCSSAKQLTHLLNYAEPELMKYRRSLRP